MEPDSRDIVVLGVQSEPDTLNPTLGYAPDGASKIFDGLLARRADLTLIPALAEALPEVSDGGLTYTFRLREGVEFHDGEPLRADDVVFTYETILDARTESPLRSGLDMISSVEAPDERTVTFRLAHPYAPFAQRALTGIVPRLAFDGVDVHRAPFNTAPVGTGPFAFDEWAPGDRLTLRANEGYWGGVPAVKRLVLAFAPDDHVRAARMERGDFDATHLPPQEAARFRDRAGLRVFDVPSADFRGVMFPLGAPVTGDPAIRLALDRAIDRDMIVQGLLDGAGTPAHGPIAPGSPFFNPAVLPEREGDLEAARAILDDAGWELGPDGTTRARDGQPARFTLLYPARDTLREDLALAVASAGARIGIDVRVEGLDWEAIRPRMASDALIMGGGTPYDPDFTSYELFHSRFGGLRDPAVDRLLDEGREAADLDSRKAAYAELQLRLSEHAAWTWLVYLDHIYVVSDRFDGLEVQVDPHTHGATHGIWWNIERWKPRQ